MPYTKEQIRNMTEGPRERHRPPSYFMEALRLRVKRLSSQVHRNSYEAHELESLNWAIEICGRYQKERQMLDRQPEYQI